MSLRINLVPHRDVRRKAIRRQFGILTGLAAAAAVLVVMVVHATVAVLEATQQARNEIVRAENARLDKDIQEIKRLRSEIEALKARKQVIERLQEDRASSVQILDQLVRLTPPGVSLKSMTQRGGLVTVTGYAANNELVADIMSNIGGSLLLRDPKLIEIKVAQASGRRLSEFALSATLLRTPGGSEPPSATLTSGSDPVSSGGKTSPSGKPGNAPAAPANNQVSQ